MRFFASSINVYILFPGMVSINELRVELVEIKPFHRAFETFVRSARFARWGFSTASGVVWGPNRSTSDTDIASSMVLNNVSIGSLCD